MAKELWIARGLEKDDGYYLFAHEPCTDNVLMLPFPDRDWLGEDIWFCKREFEKLTGIKLEPGQFQQLKVEAVGDVWELNL